MPAPLLLYTPQRDAWTSWLPLLLYTLLAGGLAGLFSLLPFGQAIRSLVLGFAELATSADFSACSIPPALLTQHSPPWEAFQDSRQCWPSSPGAGRRCCDCSSAAKQPQCVLPWPAPFSFIIASFAVYILEGPRTLPTANPGATITAVPDAVGCDWRSKYEIEGWRPRRHTLWLYESAGAITTF